MTDRKFFLQPRPIGQGFEEWVENSFKELERIFQEGGQLEPLSIDLENLSNGDYLFFDASAELWTAGNSIPGSLPPPDGDKGDIVVSLSGDTWTIDANVVTFAKFQQIATNRLLGRGAAGTGDVQEITPGNNLTLTAGGVLNAEGGSKIIRNWGPTDATFPASNFATLDVRNTHPVLDFDTSTQETVYFHGQMPDNYDGEGITVEVKTSATSATTGTIGWLVAIERLVSQDTDNDGFAADQTITAVTVPGTSGEIVSASVNIANGAAMDSLIAGDFFRIRVRRDVGNDNAAGDAELHFVEMRIQ